MTHLLVALAAFRDALDAMAAEITARLDVSPQQTSAPGRCLEVPVDERDTNPFARSDARQYGIDHGSDRLALIRSRTSRTTQDAPPPVNDAGGTGQVHPHEPDPTEPTPLHVPA